MCVKLVVEFNGCGLGTFIYQVDYGHIRNAGVGCQPDFTGTAVGISDAYAGCFYLGAEFAQGVCIQFGICEAAVAGKAAAAYFFGYDDFG